MEGQEWVQDTSPSPPSTSVNDSLLEEVALTHAVKAKIFKSRGCDGNKSKYFILSCSINNVVNE